jgi:hypothetical protein
MTRAVRATTFSKTTLSVMTLDIAIKMTLSIMAFGIKILSVTTDCIMTLNAEFPKY